jgi:hypothetical protein
MADYQLLLLATIPAAILASFVLLRIGRYPGETNAAKGPAGLARR